ncbi:retrovirus-related Pol polyprotein from transposon 297 [Trichonephila inaurata madagascariensis]|uniref:Retrovirus-related Pol polyprotein from transposon 297 n=1 Tax=Trichonephila inaurata madagascariensis TaxID=2747483 RepID=A0A8X6IW95_9ARAC|nr:retrovirus-related Pol polyprotein from transposon 297 [Trichonephila inaurata madagascariensis]
MYQVFKDKGLLFQETTLVMSLAEGQQTTGEALTTQSSAGLVLDVKNANWYFWDKPTHKYPFGKELDTLSIAEKMFSNTCQLREGKGESLTSVQKEKLNLLLESFQNIFEPGGEATTMLDHHINTGKSYLYFDGDGDEEMVVQKTPKNKTPQGRNSQSMSAKKVSFELPGKKTPQKNNSFVVKKQPTPVAKGMKGNKSVQKKNDDDEDEEEEQIQKSNSKKLNQKQTPKRKSSSEDDSDEEKEQIQKQKKVKTSSKDADKSKEQMPKANTPSKMKENGNSIEKAALWKMNAERRREKDLTELFAGNLALDVTLDELRALSSDIVDVFMGRSNIKTNTKSAKVCFFKEEDAIEAYNLKEIEIDGQKLMILFAPKFALTKNYRNKGHNKRNFNYRGYNPAKKMKFSKS